MDALLRIFRGDREAGAFQDYPVPQHEGMVVLDAVHYVQAHLASDLACRWNCKAGRCGSCSAEVNGRPRLMCMTRMDQFPPGQPITLAPMKAFPVIKDLVTDVSWNYEVNKRIPPFQPKPPEADGTWRMQQADIDRVQEFRKCIECFLCRRHRLLQHHQVLHRGVPRVDPHHGQRHHPAEGARGGRLLRPGPARVALDHGARRAGVKPARRHPADGRRTDLSSA